ncbi:toxin HicA [Anopheles sinensis]|uniref:Toxin HicA n=1 Tax=Anopheles sinensis TaxID=74873 RepID=A0A084V9W7_ANOSI|nr:toxin HicA [Anopheles sinensis]
MSIFPASSSMQVHRGGKSRRKFASSEKLYPTCGMGSLQPSSTSLFDKSVINSLRAWYHLSFGADDTGCRHSITYFSLRLSARPFVPTFSLDAFFLPRSAPAF